MPTTFITGCDRGLGLSLAKRFAAMEWRVFAGSYMPDWPELAAFAAANSGRVSVVPIDIGDDASVVAARDAVATHVSHVDLVVNNAAVTSPAMYRTIRVEQDFGEMLRLYNVNAVGALRVVHAFLPLMDGGMHRLCFVSSEAGSIAKSDRDSWFSYCMSKAALNMGVRILFNSLRPDGYTFRLLHPGWLRTYMSGERNVDAALEPDDAAVPACEYFLGDLVDEDTLVMRDWIGDEWPW